MKAMAIRVGWWVFRNLIMRQPAAATIIRDVVQSIQSNQAPIAVLARAIAVAIPGEEDNRLVWELTELPAKQWLATRGARIRLPGGRTLLEEYEAIEKTAGGD